MNIIDQGELRYLPWYSKNGEEGQGEAQHAYTHTHFKVLEAQKKLLEQERSNIIGWFGLHDVLLRLSAN